MTQLDLYRRLAELAEAELHLIENGRLEPLAAIEEERRSLIAQLPAQAPAAAREHLEQAARLNRLSLAVLGVGMKRVAGELAQLRRVRPALAAYFDAPPVRGVDTSG